MTAPSASGGPQVSSTPARHIKREVTSRHGRGFGSEVFDVAGGDVVGWIGVETQVAVGGVAKASLQSGPVVAAGLREPVAEGVAEVVGAKCAEVAGVVGGLGVVDAAD